MAHKNLGESTHPIGRTRLMETMSTSSSGSDETTYVKSPTWDIRRVPRWYASMTSSFETRTGALAGSASQIASRMQRKAQPNCINSRVTSLSVVLLTLGVPLLGFSNRFRMRRSQRFAWGTDAILECLSFTPNIRTASATGRRILKPSCTLRCISPLMNPDISGVNADAWGPLEMACSRAFLDQGSHVWTRIPSST